MKAKYLYIATMAAAGMMAGCSNDLENIFEGTNSKVVTVSAGLSDTRLAATDNGTNGVSFTWEDNDYLNVVDPVNKQVTSFSLTEGAGTAGATFEGTPATAYTEGQKLFAIFNKNKDCPVTLDDSKGVLIDLSGQDGTLNDKYQYMFGETTYSSTENTRFTLKHLVSVLKVNITVPDDVTSLSQIVLHDCATIYDKAYIALSDKNDIYSAGDLFREYTVTESQDEDGEWQSSLVESPEPTYLRSITLDRTFYPNENHIVTVYFYLLPVTCDESVFAPNTWGRNDESRSGNAHEYYLDVKDSNQNEYYMSASAMRGLGLDEDDYGNIYEYNGNLTTPFKNNGAADGTENNPYQISNGIEFNEFLIRTAYESGDYWDKYYVLTDDITLDSSDNNYFGIAFGGHLDGQNHTISGNFNEEFIFLFRDLNGATISNLNLDFTVQNNSWSPDGALAGTATDCTFTNITSYVDNATYLPIYGGIVGTATNCTFANCVNHGSISTTSEDGSIELGGIVASAVKSTFTNCSNDGTISVLSTYSNSTENSRGIAGIAGVADTDCTFTNCTNTGTISSNNDVPVAQIYNPMKITYHFVYDTANYTFTYEGSKVSGSNTFRLWVEQLDADNNVLEPPTDVNINIDAVINGNSLDYRSYVPTKLSDATTVYLHCEYDGNTGDLDLTANNPELFQ